MTGRIYRQICQKFVHLTLQFAECSVKRLTGLLARVVLHLSESHEL